MRYLGVGDSNELGDMYWRLQRRGHQVRVYVDNPADREIFRGLIPLVGDWRAELDWIRQAGDDGCVIFESAHDGPLQDELRRDGFRVIGGSGYGDRLEEDRAFGQGILKRAGLHTAPTYEFDDFGKASAFVASHPGRYVLKLNGPSAAFSRNYVGEAEDGEDIVSMLALQSRRWPKGTPTSFVLMQHLKGVEVGVGAYFDGKRFLGPACLDFEHKRFFPGDLGEQTGEMGTVATYRGAGPLFERTLAPLGNELAKSGYCGYINVNTIVNDSGIWPLEFTCRFGYPGFAVLDALQIDPWDVLFHKLLNGECSTIETRGGFSVAVVLTVPSFPYPHGYAELAKGEPIGFRSDTTSEDRDHFHYGEVELLDGHLVTSGSIGYIMVVTGRGDTLHDAQRDAYQRVEKVIIPNMRYRNDIGDRVATRDLEELTRLGWLK